MAATMRLPPLSVPPTTTLAIKASERVISKIGITPLRLAKAIGRKASHSPAIPSLSLGISLQARMQGSLLHSLHRLEDKEARRM
jgi:hypothetical protein